MSAQTYKPENHRRGHQDVIDEEYEPGADPDYDDTSQASYEETGDPEYDEGAQADYSTDFADADAQEGSQEYYKRSQK